MNCFYRTDGELEIPIAYPDNVQRWMPSLEHPYPMNFVQAPSPTNQLLVSYQGQPNLQGLSIVKGPVMFPLRERNCHPRNTWERKHTFCPFGQNKIAYPTTHSVPGPFLQSYIALPRRMYMY